MVEYRKSLFDLSLLMAASKSVFKMLSLEEMSASGFGDEGRGGAGLVVGGSGMNSPAKMSRPDLFNKVPATSLLKIRLVLTQIRIFKTNPETAGAARFLRKKGARAGSASSSCMGGRTRPARLPLHPFIERNANRSKKGTVRQTVPTVPTNIMVTGRMWTRGIVAII